MTGIIYWLMLLMLIPFHVSRTCWTNIGLILNMVVLINVCFVTRIHRLCLFSCKFNTNIKEKNKIFTFMGDFKKWCQSSSTDLQSLTCLLHKGELAKYCQCKLLAPSVRDFLQQSNFPGETRWMVVHYYCQVDKLCCPVLWKNLFHKNQKKGTLYNMW